MRLKELPVIREKVSYYDEIEKEIVRIFRTELYLPIVKELRLQVKLKNSETPELALTKAIIKGTVGVIKQDELAIFSGSFNASISKELLALGAKFIKSRSEFHLKTSQLPTEVFQALQVARVQIKAAADRMDLKLSLLSPTEISTKARLEPLFQKTIKDVDSQFKETVRSITVAPKLSESTKERIAENYTESLKLPITDFLEEHIAALRLLVRDHVLAGDRADELEKIIESSFGVAKRKAKFLARQESMLMLTAFKESRYKEIGIDSYKWRCVTGTPAHPTRPTHKALNDRSLKGEVFQFSNPPIDDKDGSRHNPGQNYNCRCVAVPIVKF
jgi:SPP1 gp7 family putative phage head morphogenesis protein